MSLVDVTSAQMINVSLQVLIKSTDCQRSIKYY